MSTEAAENELQYWTRKLGQLIEPELERYCQFDEGCPQHLAEAIRYAVLAPGKRLRPMLVLMASEACGQRYEAALPAACAVELIHAYSLVHDDLPAMDDDTLRRGRPCCHIKFGEATAILVGDALQSRAFQILADDVRPESAALRCCRELGRAAGAEWLVGGQAADLAAEAQAETGDLAMLEAIHRRKTGALFQACLRLGGHVAEADEQTLGKLDDYSRPLGLAFQIVDDLLDYYGEADRVGKATGKDAARGKLTFPELLGPDASRRRATVLISEARQAIAGFGPRAAGLDAVARFVLERNR